MVTRVALVDNFFYFFHTYCNSFLFFHTYCNFFYFFSYFFLFFLFIMVAKGDNCKSAKRRTRASFFPLEPDVSDVSNRQTKLFLYIPIRVAHSIIRVVSIYIYMRRVYIYIYIYYFLYILSYIVVYIYIYKVLF